MSEPITSPLTLAPRRPESHLDPAHAWILGICLAEDGTVTAAPALARASAPAFGPAELGTGDPWLSSAFGPCECPDFCQRDHGND